MTQSSSSPHPVSSEALSRLADSPLFTTYSEAFAAATGLDLWLGTEPAASARSSEGCSNSFCTLLNDDRNACQLCRDAHRQLTRLANDSGIAQSSVCFAGFRETSVPLRIGDEAIAWLRTGGVFADKPTERAFKKVRKILADQGLPDEQLDALHDAWFEAGNVERDAYRGMITLLAAFALQLSDLLNRILLEESQAQPEAATAARRYIDEHLDEKITLDEVASHVGISPYHFCKVFKDATSMTLTEYVNRRRVECAKRRLMRPDARVTEIAFDIGFQSLSQFNRSFARYVGMSPTQYRQRRAEDDRLRVA